MHRSQARTPAGGAGDPAEVHVGVVILNYRRWEDTLRCVEGAARQRGAALSVIVVDNASGDDSSRQIAAFLGAPRDVDHSTGTSFSDHGTLGNARAVWFGQSTRNDGYGPGNNIGMTFALTHDVDFVWVLNNDTIPQDGALAEALSIALQEPKAGIVGSRIVGDDGELQYLGGARYCVPTGRSYPARSIADLERLSYVAGCAMLIRSEALRDIGGLVEGLFLYGEEMDFCGRLRDAGWRMSVATSSVVHHSEGATVGSSKSWQDTSEMATYYSCRSAVMLTRIIRPSMTLVTWGLRIMFAVVLVFRSPRNSWAMIRGSCSGLVTSMSRLHRPKLG